MAVKVSKIGGENGEGREQTQPDLSQVMIVGRTANPEVKQFESGAQLLEFRLASHRPDRKGLYTSWITVQRWKGQQQEDASWEAFCELFSESRRVVITGSLECDEWKAQDGSSRSKHYVRALQIQFMDAPPASREEKPSEQAAPAQQDSLADTVAKAVALALKAQKKAPKATGKGQAVPLQVEDLPA